MMEGETTALVAPFRILLDGAEKREITATARIDYADEKGETTPVDYGTWLGEDFNFVTISPTDTKSLILGLFDKRTLLIVQDHRHSVSKSYGVSNLEVTGPLEVHVTLVDFDKGTLLGDYWYQMTHNSITIKREGQQMTI